MPIVRRDDPYSVIHMKGVDIPLNFTTIIKDLEIPEIPNYNFED